MKTIFETNRWILYTEKSGSTLNGNGWLSWSIVLRKVVGNGDDGTRNNLVQSAQTK